MLKRGSKNYGMALKIVARDERHKDGAKMLRGWWTPRGKTYKTAGADSREAKRRFSQRVSRLGML